MVVIVVSWWGTLYDFETGALVEQMKVSEDDSTDLKTQVQNDRCVIDSNFLLMQCVVSSFRLHLHSIIDTRYYDVSCSRKSGSLLVEWKRSERPRNWAR